MRGGEETRRVRGGRTEEEEQKAEEESEDKEKEVEVKEEEKVAKDWVCKCRRKV